MFSPIHRFSYLSGALCGVGLCLLTALLSSQAVAQVATGQASSAPGSVLVYRAAPSPASDNTALSLWLYSAGAQGSARVYVMASGGRVSDPAPVRGAGEDTEPLWPAWISAPIPLSFTGWKHVVLTPDELIYRPPAGASPDALPALPFTAADVVGISTDTHRGAVYVDNIAWREPASATAPAASPVLIDDFEQGDTAAWTVHGAPEAASALELGITLQPAFVEQGRCALKLGFSRSAALHAAGMRRLAAAMAFNHAPYAVFVPSSPFDREYPNSVPQPGEMERVMQTFACAGQVQPASFCLYSRRSLGDVTVFPKMDLLGAGHKVPRSAIDIRVVKMWDRQGVGPLRDPDAEGVVPELLVKDDRQPLDMAQGAAPDVRLVGDPLTDIPAGSAKQFWLDISVPPNTPADSYSSEIEVRAPGVKPTTVLLIVDVLPLHLVNPSKQYAIGFRGKLGAPAPGTPASVTDTVSANEFAAELSDIAAHGFRYATLTDQPPALWDAVAAYQQAGLGAPVVYEGLTGQGDMDEIKTIEQDRASLKDPSFFYVVPPTADQVKEMDAVRNDNLQTASFVPNQSTFDSLKNDLDLAIYPADESYAQKLLQTGGQRIFMNRDWWTWPSAQADPQVDRLYAGYLLWRTDLYGAYASDYQTCWGTDPFDDSSPGAPADKAMYRPAMLTYPAAGGVIDTIQWEAAREGITDVRYLTTFYAALRECKDNHLAPDLVKTSQDQVTAFLNKAFWELSDSDYQAERARVAHYATILRQTVNAYYKKQGLPVY